MVTESPWSPEGEVERKISGQRTGTTRGVSTGSARPGAFKGQTTTSLTARFVCGSSLLPLSPRLPKHRASSPGLEPNHSDPRSRFEMSTVSSTVATSEIPGQPPGPASWTPTPPDRLGQVPPGAYGRLRSDMTHNIWRTSFVQNPLQIGTIRSTCVHNHSVIGGSRREPGGPDRSRVEADCGRGARPQPPARVADQREISPVLGPPAGRGDPASEGLDA